MSRNISALLMCFLLISCGSMTNEEVIKELKVCEEANLRTLIVQHTITKKITGIICLPKMKGQDK